MAPEILEGKEKYDNKCDLWSIGVLIYQLYFNEFPYKASTEVAILNNIKKLGQKVIKNTDNEDLDNLIRGLLVYDTDKRLSWDKYFEHPFFCLEQKRIKEDYTKHYEIEDRIGKGCFGKVYKAIDKESKELRAIKIIELDENENEIANEFIDVLKNMKICSNNKNNLYSVKLYEYFKNKSDLVIVMELCDNNLYKVLESRKKCFNSKEIFKIMNQLNDTFKIMVKNKILWLQKYWKVMITMMINVIYGA
jgi:serine/threonine protein kinase